MHPVGLRPKQKARPPAEKQVGAIPDEIKYATDDDDGTQASCGSVPAFDVGVSVPCDECPVPRDDAPVPW